jgi:uncharacterized membrane protein YphA (DoxX/SURF4 family)
METLVKVSRISYCIMISALAAQQIFYKAFRPVILPPWHLSFPGLALLVYIVSAIFIAGGIAIIFNKNARIVSLILGGIFLFLFLFCQIPYELIANPYYKDLGAWASAEKELVLAGGGFVVAGSFPANKKSARQSSFIISSLEKLIPFGGVLMCITIVSFGIDHLLYAKGISTLVPAWIGAQIFWTYFAGVALIVSGMAIILRVQLRWSALLLSLMIFIWLIVLHIPRAIADPYGLQGNEVSSVFEAFGFSGIAYLIAYGYHAREKI